MSLSYSKNIYNNYNNNMSYNMSSKKEGRKKERYNNTQFGHNKNIKFKSDRLHFILSKI